MTMLTVAKRHIQQTALAARGARPSLLPRMGTRRFASVATGFFVLGGGSASFQQQLQHVHKEEDNSLAALSLEREVSTEKEESPNLVQLWFAWCRLVTLSLPLSFFGLFGWMFGGFAEECFWSYAMWATQQAGPTVVKLAQWASSRDDRFPAEFCQRFSRLQSSARAHGWRHTEKALEKALGAEWRQYLQIDDLIGSGCAAQVYRGTILKETGDSRRGDEVAVKIVHPAMRARVATDLALIRLAARLVETFSPSAKWLSLPQAVDEFGKSLSAQMDMRLEAFNLERLGRNFSTMAQVKVPRPRLSLSSEDVLVEDFALGIPISDVMSRKVETTPLLRSKLSKLGVDCVCKMIFHDNLVHGDLHPGNLLVEFDGEKQQQPVLTLLDAGIVVELGPEKHRHLVDVLGALMRHDGYAAGKLILRQQDQKKRRAAAVRDNRLYDDYDAEAAARGSDEQFCNVLKDITAHCADQAFFDHVGDYATRIFKSAATNHVSLPPYFVSTSIAIRVMEGVASALDKDVKIGDIAVPWVLTARYHHHNPFSR